MGRERFAEVPGGQQHVPNSIPVQLQSPSKGPFTRTSFVAQLNAIFVALNLQPVAISSFHRDFSAICQCKGQSLCNLHSISQQSVNFKTALVGKHHTVKN